MKKLLYSSILALAGLGLSAAPSQAWTFGLIPCHCWPCFGCFGCGCCGGCCSKICVKPYNAFSPVACGSMCFDGCCPFNGGCPAPGGYPGYGPGGYPGYGPGAGYGPGPEAGYGAECCPDGCAAGMPGPGGDGYAQGAVPAGPGAPIAVSPAQPGAAPMVNAGPFGAMPPLAPNFTPYGGNGR